LKLNWVPQLKINVFIRRNLIHKHKKVTKKLYVACGPALEGVACALALEDAGIPLPIKEAGGACGPALEDAASKITSYFVACGPVACEDKGVTSLGIPKVTSLDRRLFEAAIRILDRTAGLFLEIVFFFPEGDTIGMFKPFK
jgi:hypothetical protein